MGWGLIHFLLNRCSLGCRLFLVAPTHHMHRSKLLLHVGVFGKPVTTKYGSNNMSVHSLFYIWQISSLFIGKCQDKSSIPLRFHQQQTFTHHTPQQQQTTTFAHQSNVLQLCRKTTLHLHKCHRDALLISLQTTNGHLHPLIG